MNDLLTFDETAEGLRMTPSNLRYLRSQGRAPRMVKIGRRLYCRRADLEAFLAALPSA